MNRYVGSEQHRRRKQKQTANKKGASSRGLGCNPVTIDTPVRIRSLPSRFTKVKHMQITVEDFKQFLNEFRGDIDVYSDGSVQFRPYDVDKKVFGGVDFTTAVERQIKKLKK